MGDPGLFTLPCRLGDSKPFDTLADLGSCVNIIPLYLFKKLNIGLLEETNNVFGLADGTKSYPVGIVRGILSYRQRSYRLVVRRGDRDGGVSDDDGCGDDSSGVVVAGEMEAEMMVVARWRGAVVVAEEVASVAGPVRGSGGGVGGGVSGDGVEFGRSKGRRRKRWRRVV
ncbi:hypothetical protein Tco_1045064 [Tanacetum coccineum]|uniref:Uncharacterized protein n=1 Tax=Tanacetum coccineum TaxID=301880 RepID=A0ABQ5GS78_9ASTR